MAVAEEAGSVVGVHVVVDRAAVAEAAVADVEGSAK